MFFFVVTDNNLLEAGAMVTSPMNTVKVEGEPVCTPVQMEMPPRLSPHTSSPPCGFQVRVMEEM